MLEKLRDNPRAVVAALIAAGILAVVIGAGGQNNNDTDQNEQDPGIVVETSDISGEEVENNGLEVQSDGAETPEVIVEGSESSSSLEVEPQEGPVEVSSNEGVLSATVRSGDNQTVIARQMISDYLDANEESLSEEQRLFAETHVVNSMPRSDIIHPGEEIRVEESTLADIISQSMELDEAAIARWSAYL